VDFPSQYLRSVIGDYAEQRDRYTLTDLQVEYREKEERSPDGSERQPDKQVERLEVLAGLRKYVRQGHVLLVGKPGSGKSTALQRLRWELAQAALVDERQPIPVLVALRDDRSTLEAICAEFRPTGERVKPEQVDELLLDGRLFLLLDGLNEIPSQEREHQVNQFRKDNPRTPMIFTSREMGTGLGIEQKLEMCGLTEQQMRSFVQNYLPNYAQVLLRQLKDRLQELAETPLLLKLLCDVFDPATQQFPQSKGKLFQDVDAKYNKWKGKESVRTDKNFWRWNGEILRYLAFVMLQADGTPTGKWLRIEKSQAEHLLENFLQDRVTAPGEKAKDWLDDLLKHHLLRPIANSNQIEFHHQLFQEYYAAEYLLQEIRLHPDWLEKMPDQPYAWFQQKYLNLLKWTESLAVMVSLLADGETAVQAVKLGLEVDLILGAKLAGSVRRDFQPQTVNLIQVLELPLLFKVKLLGYTRSQEVVSTLISALKDQNSDVCLTVVHELGKIGTDAANLGLLQALEHQNSQVIVSIANRISQLDHKANHLVIDVLVKLLDHQNPAIRKNVVETSRIIGNEDVLPVLLKALEDEDFGVRSRAAFALSGIGIETISSKLIEMLKHPNPGVRDNVAHLLGRPGNLVAVDGLLQALEEDSDDDVRWKAAHSLGVIGSVSAVPKLCQNLKHQKWDIRLSAAYALVNLGQEDAISEFFTALENEDAEVRLNAALALALLDRQEAISELLKALEDPGDIKTRDRLSIVYSLGQLGSKAVIPGLLTALRDPASVVRFTAVRELGKVGDEAIIPDLLSLLDDQDLTVRYNVVEAFENLINPAILPGLLRALEDQELSVRLKAISVMESINHEMVVPGLFKALEDQNFDIRWSAAESLKRLGFEDVRLPLSRETTGSSSNTQNWTNNVLSEIDSDDLIESCFNMLEDPNPTVRLMVAGKLGQIGQSENLAQLWQLRFAEQEDSAMAIYAIQSRCQFYNYEIFCSDPEPEDDPASRETDRILINMLKQIAQGMKTMSNQPKNDFSGANFTGSVNFGDNPTGDFIGTQHNYAPIQNFTEAAQQLTKVLNKLRQKYPNAPDPELFQILINGFEAMPQKNPQNWQQWRDVFSVLFSGGVEATKILLPIAGIPIEVGKRLYEIYDRNRKQLPSR